MDFDNYRSYLLIFEKLLGSFEVNDVLEFGMGEYSTPFLAQRCRRIVSVEQESRQRYDRTVAAIQSPNWEPFFECNPAAVFEHFDRQKRQFDLVFSDGVPQTRCLIANLAMRKHVPFVVLHDAEKVWHYRWNLLDIPETYYRFNYRHRDSAGKVTTLLTNTGQEEIDKWEIPGCDRVVHAYAGPRQPVLEIKLSEMPTAS
jgi:hypothetical protein